MAKSSKTMLNKKKKKVDSGYPCVAPDFRGNAFSFLPLRMMSAVGMLYIVFRILS